VPFSKAINWYCLSNRAEGRIQSLIAPGLRHKITEAILVPVVPRLGFGSRIYAAVRRGRKNEPGH